MPVTLTVPTTKIKSRIDHRLPSATPLTVRTPVVVIHNDGQQVLRRQAAMTRNNGGDGDGDAAVLHVCRTARLSEPVDPGRVLFPAVHKTGAIGAGR